MEQFPGATFAESSKNLKDLHVKDVEARKALEISEADRWVLVDHHGVQDRREETLARGTPLCQGRLLCLLCSEFSLSI